jgi:hypothetical protein
MKIESLLEIQNLPTSCVYGFINDSTKEYYVSHTQNLRSRIGAIIDSCPVLTSESRLDIICELDDKEYKMVLAEVYKRKYKDLGYKDLGRGGEYINYKAKVQYSWDLSCAYVVISNKRGFKKIVGAFKTIEEADMFYDQYYASQKVVVPVYANNGMTRDLYINV